MDRAEGMLSATSDMRREWPRHIYCWQTSTCASAMVRSTESTGYELQKSGDFPGTCHTSLMNLGSSQSRSMGPRFHHPHEGDPILGSRSRKHRDVSTRYPGADDLLLINPQRLGRLGTSFLVPSFFFELPEICRKSKLSIVNAKKLRSGNQTWLAGKSTIYSSR